MPVLTRLSKTAVPTTFPDPAALAAADVGMPACSHDEFSPLTEVVVGTSVGARTPTLDRSAWLNLYPDLSASELRGIAAGGFPPSLLAEAEEDLDTLAATLSKLGVTVHRPTPVDHAAVFASPYWRTTGFHSYCPRDLALVVGNVIIQSPSPMRARMYELVGLRDLFQQKMLAGSPWIAGPTPQLRDELYPLDESGRPVLAEVEPVFEAANVLRCGRDILYLVSGSGNELGWQWLRTTLSAFGEYRMHPIRDVYRYTHIDSTISLIRPGLVLLNPARIRSGDVLPEPMRSWKHLWCPPMATKPSASPYPLSSEWLGMNLLMVRPDLAIVDSQQQELIRLLEAHRIEVLPILLRHARVLGGGFHCVTLDIRRQSIHGGSLSDEIDGRNE
jgi:N-dimethylarginine dimethylaminohydrolase